MSTVVQFHRRAPSREVVKNLVRLGYLKRQLTNNTVAVEDALARLREDLCRDQTITADDPPKSS